MCSKRETLRMNDNVWFATSALPAPGESTLVYGHRGAMAYAPQNTVPSFELAWEMKAHGIELDVQCSRDGVPVVFHDDTLDRLTDGTGAVSSLDLDDLRRLDAGSRFSARFAGERIPLLATILRSRPAGTYVNIEIKTALPSDPPWRQLVRPVAGHPVLSVREDGERELAVRVLVERTEACIRDVSRLVPELPAWLIVSSFDPAALQFFRKLRQDIPLAFLHSPSLSFDTRPAMRCIPHQAWHPLRTEASRKSVVLAHHRGRLVNCWTVNTRLQALALVRCGVDGLITNRPDVLLRVLEEPCLSREEKIGKEPILPAR